MNGVYALVLARLIYSLRRRKKLSQKAVADRLGINQARYSRMERAQAELPTRLLPPLLEAIEMGFDRFFNLVEEAMDEYLSAEEKLNPKNLEQAEGLVVWSVERIVRAKVLVVCLEDYATKVGADD